MGHLFQLLFERKHFYKREKIWQKVTGGMRAKTAVAQQASKEVETSLVSDFSPVFYRYTNVFL